jgi:hypothetical protein
MSGSRMDVIRLRKSFAAFAGADRYRRFIMQIREREYFRTWHERLWSKFVATAPEFAAATFAEIKAALAVCELHGDELQTYVARVLGGKLPSMSHDDEVMAWLDLFPNNKQDVWDPFLSADTVERQFCPACYEAQCAWETSRRF